MTRHDQQVGMMPQELIPHRYPFLFVDEIAGYEKGRWITGVKRISQNDRLCWSASPVLLCEALAQLSKVLESLSDGALQGTISYLAALQIDFYQSAGAGDAVELSAHKEKEFKSMVCYRVTASSSRKILLEGTLFRKTNT